MTKTQRLVQWFGSNAMQPQAPGRLLDGCRFVAIPFAGGMSEVPYITAKQVLVNDLHRHIINLCLVIQNAEDREWLVVEADGLPYHPEALAASQRSLTRWEWKRMPSREAALFYFVCVWMGRGGQAGTPGELKGALPVRWNAGGGGSNRRYRTAIEALDGWGRVFRRCEFVCMDAFRFLTKCKDDPTHGYYIDAPWPDAGDEYTHRFSLDDQKRLADVLGNYENSKVVIRFGEHSVIRRLYAEDRWTWLPAESRTQANQRQQEWLICNWETRSAD